MVDATTKYPRVFLVMPDVYNGGSEHEGFVIAHSPQEACEMWHQFLESGTAIEVFVFAPGAVERGDCDVWAVRELPLGEFFAGYGPVSWKKFPLTCWKLQMPKQEESRC
jgi:hypothetical protein